ncbi:MAG: 4Fe-4S dicluster domain-containing protein [Chloroflexi bacterium]|nr:4Fe-4S dicluster domain-containing protein [Chloroflexota bacterium]
MKSLVIIPSPDFRRELETESGERVSSCIQCGKCSGSCPVFAIMDLGPRRLMRAVQLGLREEALGSNTLWLCLFCMTCSSRCPMKIDVARVIETLRHRAIKEGVRPADREIALFHRLFLAEIEALGRAYELGLGGAYGLLTLRPWTNLREFGAMLRRGKVPFIPERAAGSGPLFEKARKAGG